MIYLTFDFRLISKDNEKIFNRQGRPFLSKKFKDFENRVRLETFLQHQGKSPLPGDVKLRVVAHFKNKVHPDATNLFKGICDAWQDILYKNDRQIKKAEIEIQYSDKDWFEVYINELL